MKMWRKAKMILQNCLLSPDGVIVSSSNTIFSLGLFLSNFQLVHTEQSFLSHTLVYNGGFQTLNCRYSFGTRPLWPKFCVALVTSMIYFHNKIWNH